MRRIWREREIKATLYDAEEKEIKDLSINLWLKEYDAEDVLSEYWYKVTQEVLIRKTDGG